MLELAMPIDSIHSSDKLAVRPSTLMKYSDETNADGWNLLAYPSNAMQSKKSCFICLLLRRYFFEIDNMSIKCYISIGQQPILSSTLQSTLSIPIIDFKARILHASTFDTLSMQSLMFAYNDYPSSSDIADNDCQIYDFYVFFLCAKSSYPDLNFQLLTNDPIVPMVENPSIAYCIEFSMLDAVDKDMLVFVAIA